MRGSKGSKAGFHPRACLWLKQIPARVRGSAVVGPTLSTPGPETECNSKSNLLEHLQDYQHHYGLARP